VTGTALHLAIAPEFFLLFSYARILCLLLLAEIKYVGYVCNGWLGSGVVSVLDSGAVGPGFKSQSRRCRVTVLGKLFTPIVCLFTTQQNW